MNELFFSAMFIGSLLFGNSKTNEIPSELNINQIETPQTNPTGTITLISNNSMKFIFKVTGDAVNNPLKIYVNGQPQGQVSVPDEFEVKRPVQQDNENTILIELKSTNGSIENIYASYVISF